uniref:Uncharacterized protein n=1 Tax=Lepeophtheirus salmonis TaxID=72036 RepID=A0A0K2UWY0_LEPSM
MNTFSLSHLKWEPKTFLILLIATFVIVLLSAPLTTSKLIK